MRNFLVTFPQTMFIGMVFLAASICGAQTVKLNSKVDVGASATQTLNEVVNTKANRLAFKATAGRVKIKSILLKTDKGDVTLDDIMASSASNPSFATDKRTVDKTNDPKIPSAITLDFPAAYNLTAVEIEFENLLSIAATVEVQSISNQVSVVRTYEELRDALKFKVVYHGAISSGGTPGCLNLVFVNNAANRTIDYQWRLWYEDSCNHFDRSEAPQTTSQCAADSGTGERALRLSTIQFASNNQNAGFRSVDMDNGVVHDGCSSGTLAIVSVVQSESAITFKLANDVIYKIPKDPSKILYKP